VGKALQARGHAITIAGRDRSRLLAAAADAGLPVEGVRFGNDLDLGTILRVRDLLVRRRIEVVLNTFDKEVRIAGIAARSLGRGRAPRILIRKGLPLIGDNWRYRVTYAHLVDGILTPAESIRRRLAGHPWLSVPIHVLPNGVDLVRFGYRPERAPSPDPAWPAVPGGLLVVHLARLSGQKGHRILLGAAAALRERFPRVRYVLVGDGAERAAIAAARSRLGLEEIVHLAGHRLDSPAVLAAADVVVLPSLDEGYPNVLIEAMAVGRPVVASAVGDTPAIVRDGESGFLVPPGAIAPFVERLGRLLADPALRVRMGAEARAHAEAGHGHAAMVAGAARYLSAEARVARSRWERSRRRMAG
jgi:glycosyltransferase involved in cell wall biosynthesis